jgi:hypothetical protein
MLYIPNATIVLTIAVVLRYLYDPHEIEGTFCLLAQQNNYNSSLAV